MIKLVKESLFEDLSDEQPWNKVYNYSTNLIQSKKVTSVEDLLISLYEKYGKMDDDIEDAAWAAWEDNQK